MISVLVLLSSIHIVYFPAEIEDGIHFEGQAYDNSVSLSTIYQNLSNEGFTLKNVTESVVIDDCNQGACEIDFEDVEQLRVTSDDWEKLNAVLIWENPEGNIEFKGNSSLEIKHLFDVNLFARNSERCKEDVVEIMGLSGIKIEKNEVNTVPLGIYSSIPICFGMVLLIVFFFALLLVIILDETKKGEKEDFSVEKMLSFIAVPGLFLVLMHALRVGGYSSTAGAIFWILPLSLGIVAVLFYVPWEYKYGKLLIIGLIGLIIYLLFVTTRNPSSSCFVCCVAVPLIGMIILFVYLLIRDMENE